MRIIFSLLGSLGLILSAVSAAERPNIVFILADDLGWADTTLYGHTSYYQTPNIERLAARGTTFNRAYTASPLCSPTRSSILTGLHPARTGLTAPSCHLPKVVLKASARDTAAPDRKLTAYEAVTRLDPKYETLSERFQAEGYATGHFGKWHLGAEPYSPLENGFDIDIPHHHGPGPAGSFVAPWKFKDFKEKYPGEHIEDRMGNEAAAFMEAHKDEPFFLNYWQFSVHAPFDAKKTYIDAHRERIDPNDEQRSPTYAAMVQSLDENVGRVLDAIDELGIADRTVIVFYSDNGGNMYNEVDGTTPTANRPLRGGKGNNWDGGVRVPCIVVWPGVTKPGSRSDELITSTDFYPTLLEMCDLNPSTGQKFDGVSIVPALKGKELNRDAIFTFFPHSTGVPDTLPPSSAIYQGDWKLLRLFHNAENGNHEHRLFHLGDDIGERSNLATQQPERVASMAAKLDAFLTETGAVYPKPNPNYDATTAELTRQGWRATRGCSLKLEKDHLAIQTTEANAHVTLQLSEPATPGAYTLRLRLKPNHPGRIDLRWSEKGVKPLFFRNRLTRSDSYQGNAWQSIDLSLIAEHPLTSFRIDFMQPAGRIDLEFVELRHEGKINQDWNFDGKSQ